MSKPIRFPILEIVTLLVVLFACGLVIIPGFDRYATSMLFDLNRRQPSTEADVVENGAENGAFITPGEPDFSPPRRLVADRATLDVTDESRRMPRLEIPAELQLKGNIEKADPDQPGDRLERIPESLQAPRVDELAVQELSPARRPHIPRPSRDAVKRSDSIDESISPPNGMSRLNRFIESRNAVDAQTGSASDLATVFHRVGNSLQQQPSPTRIRMAQALESDVRIVVNSTLIDESKTWLSTTVTESEPDNGVATGTSPNDRPYQVRTTARPRIVEPSNPNDFVPKR